MGSTFVFPEILIEPHDLTGLVLNSSDDQRVTEACAVGPFGTIDFFESRWHASSSALSIAMLKVLK